MKGVYVVLRCNLVFLLFKKSILNYMNKNNIININKVPLIIYILSSIILVYLFHNTIKKKKLKTDIIIPQISQTGMKNFNKKAYYIYLISFLIIGLLTSNLYWNQYEIKGKHILTKILQFIGLIACFLNIVQGYYSLDTHKKLHEMSAYGGIFLHLLVLSIWLYYNRRKDLTIVIALSWLSILLMGPMDMINFNIGSIFQRLCVFFLLLALYMY